MAVERTPPANGADRVGQAVSALAAVGAPETLAPEAGGQALDVSKPLPIYSLGEPDSGSEPGKVLDRTSLVGWRYLVFGGPAPFMADLSPGDDVKSPKLVRSAELVNRVIAAGRLAQKVIDKDSSYEVRLLDLDLLGRSALWLFSEDQNKPDHFVRLGKTPQQVDAKVFLEEVSAVERIKAATFASATDEAGG